MKPGEALFLWEDEDYQIIGMPRWWITPDVARIVAEHWDFFGDWSFKAGVGIGVSEDAEPAWTDPPVIRITRHA